MIPLSIHSPTEEKLAEPTVSSIVVRSDDSPQTANTGGNWRGEEGVARE